jgi:hypothetical protein
MLTVIADGRVAAHLTGNFEFVSTGGHLRTVLRSLTGHGWLK